MSPLLLLVDANPFIWKAYHGGGEDIGYRSDGLPTGSVAGFLARLDDLMSKDLKDHRFTHVAAVFDVVGKNWRHTLASDYKGTREPPPEDLSIQLRMAKHLTPMLGLHAVQQRGYEADDLIATYARVCDEADGETVIVSSDKDLQQLIKPGTAIYTPIAKKGEKAGRWINELAEMGSAADRILVPPSQVADIMALWGDTTDNIDGVPGIGVKTAAKIIAQFGDLESALAGAAQAKIRPVLQQNLIEFADRARMSRKLVALDDRVPLKVPFEALTAYPMRAAELLSALAALELEKFGRWIAFKANLQADRAVPCPRTAAIAAEMMEIRGS